MKYRYDFAYKYLFGGVSLKGKKCLDAMCGGGEWTSFIINNNGIVSGIDISKKCCDIYKDRYPQCDIYCKSILNTGFQNDFFDIIVTDSLHHLQPNLDKCVNEMYRILKPGGYLIFWEPHSGSILNFFRKIWYKTDDFFESNEKAVNVNSLKLKNKSRFLFEKEKYGGNFGYFFIVHSMIFRFNPVFKKYYAKVFFLLENLFQIIQFKFNSAYVLCRWKKIKK